jgi:hypothetical protein
MNPIDYVKRGFYIFPLRPGDKKPLKEFKWREESSNDISKVKQWASEYPDANWGLDCGKSGLCVIDVDPKNGGFDTLKALPSFKSEFSVRTPSGGYHEYFKGDKKTGTNCLGKGVDIRSNGGYVVIPGSRVKDIPYVSVTKGKIPDLPEWVDKKLTRPREKVVQYNLKSDVIPDGAANIEQAIDYLKNESPITESGDRNNTLVRVARTLWDWGISKETATELIQEYWNSDRVSPPMSYKELIICVRSAYAKPENPFGVNTTDYQFQMEQACTGIFDELETETVDDPFKLPMAVESEEVVQKPPKKEPKDKKGLLPELFTASSIREADIPIREHVLRRRYTKQVITVTHASGGSSKSTLTLLEAIAVSTGRQLLDGFEVIEPGNVIVFNMEDTLDEMQRRVSALCKTYNVPIEELERLHLVSMYGKKFHLVQWDTKNGRKVVKNLELIKELAKMCMSVKPVLISFDPLVNCHSCSENDNMDMIELMSIFTEFANRLNCAVGIVHHNRKSSGSGKGNGNDDEGRGASSIFGAARITHSLNVMSEEEAKQAGLEVKQRFSYIKLKAGKANFEEPGDHETWFHRSSVTIANGEEVGSIEPYNFVSVEREEANILTFINALYSLGGNEISYNQLVTQIRVGLTKEAAESLLETIINSGQTSFMAPDTEFLYHLVPGDRSFRGARFVKEYIVPDELF